MTQLKRGDGDGANEDRVGEEDRPDEVQAEEDEGELFGKHFKDVCEICGKVFTAASILSKHIVTTVRRNH